MREGANGRRLCVIGVALMAIVGCGRSGGEVRGSITGDGSSTVLPITEAVAEEFGREDPDVRVSVRASGTGGGFKKFCAGETDIQDASRPIKDEEKQACSAGKVEYIELTVALDGLAVVVHPETDWVDCLTTAELAKIWQPRSKVTSWSQIRPGFPSKRLKLFGPGTDSGTFDYFTDAINGEEGLSRSDYTANENDDVLVKGVAGTEGALGYFGYSYYVENKGSLKVLGVDGGAGCVVPSDETVRSDEYKPLSRPLFVYVKTSALARPEVKAFMQFYLENVSLLLPDVGYTPVADDVIEREKSELKAASGP